MLYLLMLLMADPPAVQLRGDAPPVVDWPEGLEVLRGSAAQALGQELEVDQPESVVSAEAHIGHYGQLESISFHRRPSPSGSPLFCLPNVSGISVRGADSPDYPGWMSPEEAARLRADSQTSDSPEASAIIPLDAAESCETVDPALRDARTFELDELIEALGALNRLRRAVAWGEIAPPPCGPAPCDPAALITALTPSQVESARRLPDREPGCWWIEFRTSAGSFGGWSMTLCERDFSTARINSVPRFS